MNTKKETIPITIIQELKSQALKAYEFLLKTTKKDPNENSTYIFLSVFCSELELSEKKAFDTLEYLKESNVIEYDFIDHGCLSTLNLKIIKGLKDE